MKRQPSPALSPSLLHHHALFPQLHVYGSLMYPLEMQLPKFQPEELALGVLQTDFVEDPPPLPALPPLRPNASVCPPPSQPHYLQPQLHPRLVLSVLASVAVGLLWLWLPLPWSRLRHSLSRIFQLTFGNIASLGEIFTTRLGGPLARKFLV